MGAPGPPRQADNGIAPDPIAPSSQQGRYRQLHQSLAPCEYLQVDDAAARLDQVAQV